MRREQREMRHHVSFSRPTTFVEGGPLASRDLQADMEAELRMHRLHVGTVHHTWGVALGLELTLTDDRRRVKVGPGLAYDSVGRPILLAEVFEIGGPKGPE